jgi:hypothetical protein
VDVTPSLDSETFVSKASSKLCAAEPVTKPMHPPKRSSVAAIKPKTIVVVLSERALWLRSDFDWFGDDPALKEFPQELQKLAEDSYW